MRIDNKTKNSMKKKQYLEKKRLYGEAIIPSIENESLSSFEN